MVRGEKSEYMRNNRRMVRSKDNGSDESDEDYMVGEEEDIDESEDEYCSPFDGNESDEFLDELEEEEEDDDDDEEEEFVEKKVRKVGRPKGRKTGHARRRKKNGFVKPKRKKRALHSEEEEEDDDDADFNFSDERTNKATKPQKKKRISESEEEDDYDCADYDFDDEKINEAVKRRKKKRISYREEDEDRADCDFNDERVNIAVRPRVKKKASYKEEDDDYDVANDMFDDETVNIVARPRVKKKASYKEEDDYDVENEIYDDEMISQAAKRRKGKEVSYREEDDDDYDGNDDDDDNDEEFTPDEIDGVEDEDDLLVAKKNKKVGRAQLQEKVVTIGRKRKRNSKGLKKSVTKKPRNNFRRRRTTKNENNGELIGSEPIVEDKIKKINRRGKRRRTVVSDSDFASCGSSDFEFTISEEEREQVQEANRFCRSLTTSLRSSSSSNKLEEEKEMLTQRKRPGRKGKERVEEMKVEAGKQVCGICLTEEGKRTVRGTLNCCSHYFCFACIMEWSKVESRCPLCKQRFVTISKPARSDTGFDLRTVVIQIPERDQVYQPSEEELQGFLDPYDNVICTECHQGGDDALMLLCDLCDSPAHTYCVGLGRDVPEGNWYCEGCRPAALGSSNPQVLTQAPDFRTNSNLSVRSSPVSAIRETFDLNEIYVPDTPLTHETGQLQSPRPSVRDVQLPSPASGSGAFTVLERRRIQHQIHQLLNNRRRQMDDRVPQTPTTVSGHSLFGSQVGRSRELATQHVPTQERMSSSNIYFHGSLQDNTMPLFQNCDLPSSRLAHIGGQLSQSQPSTSTNRSFSGYMQEFDGLNTSIGLRLGHQQLQPCSGSSNMGSDASRSSYPFREAMVPPRTLQGALRTQF